LFRDQLDQPLAGIVPFMTRIEVFRKWYEQEKDSNTKMLEMIASVLDSNRRDERFHRALVLAHHLAACRENWLDRMIRGSESQVAWWDEDVSFQTLRQRYDALEKRWTEYLANLDDERLAEDFEFPIGSGKRYRWNVEGQIMQLVGHAFYHRGQIALLVDQLGGETIDTDYLYWATQQQPERWKALES
jgi:uncharacterized damage-inducible protein DinB